MKDKKIEHIFLRTSQNLSELNINSIQVGDRKIEALQHIHNIGAIVDQHVKIEQVTAGK